MKPTHCFDPRNFRVDEIAKDLIQPIIIKNHYLHRLELGPVRNCFSIVKIDDLRLVGVLVFGEPVRRNLSKSISSLLQDNEVIELLRVWIEDGHGSNIESWSISQAFRMLPKERKVIASYADSSHVDEFGRAHTGKIYQALGGLYQELSGGNTIEISLDGGKTWLHERKQGRTFGKHSLKRLPQKVCQNFLYRMEPRKYRYIWLRGSDKEKKLILDTLKHPISAYPKVAMEPAKIEEIIVTSE